MASHLLLIDALHFIVFEDFCLPFILLDPFSPACLCVFFLTTLAICRQFNYRRSVAMATDRIVSSPARGGDDLIPLAYLYADISSAYLSSNFKRLVAVLGLVVMATSFVMRWLVHRPLDTPGPRRCRFQTKIPPWREQKRKKHQFLVHHITPLFLNQQQTLTSDQYRWFLLAYSVGFIGLGVHLRAQAVSYLVLSTRMIAIINDCMTNLKESRQLFRWPAS